MAVNRYFNNFPSQERINNEHLLLEDLIVESIQIMGQNVYYVPRESFDAGDMILGEYKNSAFNKAYLIESYLINVEGHEGQQDFFSKFGLEIRDNDRFVMSRRSFRHTLPSTIRERPQEGDLIYVPLLHKMYEIKFVEHESNYHQIGKRLPYIYEIKCEAFRASQEQISTGIPEVDQVGIDNLATTELVLGYGYVPSNFLMGEVVYQSKDGTFANNTAHAIVKDWFGANSTLMIYNVVGNFSNTGNVYGQTSSSKYAISISDNMTDYTYYDMFDNKQLNTDAGEILDLTEFNPFGTP